MNLPLCILVFKREQKGKKDAAELKRKQRESEKKDTMKKTREDGEIVPEVYSLFCLYKQYPQAIPFSID